MAAGEICLLKENNLNNNFNNFNYDNKDDDISEIDKKNIKTYNNIEYEKDKNITNLDNKIENNGYLDNSKCKKK